MRLADNRNLIRAGDMFEDDAYNLRLQNLTLSPQGSLKAVRGKSMCENTGKTHEKPIVWGAPGSAFSGKTRSCFIKKGIAYEEIFPPHPRY